MGRQLFKSVLPEVFDIIYQIYAKLCGELMARKFVLLQDEHHLGQNSSTWRIFRYIARAMSSGCGAAQRDTVKRRAQRMVMSLIRRSRQNNKTNALHSARWLVFAIPNWALSRFRIGQGYLSNLEQIGALKEHLSDSDIEQFNEGKRLKKNCSAN
jgi:glucan phosphorylase